MSFGDAQNVKLAIGAGKGGATAGAVICRSAGATAGFRAGRSRTAFGSETPSAGFGACFAAVRFVSALPSLADLPPVLRPAFRSGRAFAMERATLLATPGSVNSVSAA